MDCVNEKNVELTQDDFPEALSVFGGFVEQPPRLMKLDISHNGDYILRHYFPGKP